MSQCHSLCDNVLVLVYVAMLWCNGVTVSCHCVNVMCLGINLFWYHGNVTMSLWYGFLLSQCYYFIFFIVSQIHEKIS